ncbi:MAG: Zn-ribbon domain-containing OB-fold protein [Actinomycetota bacterium]|nr:Zn-ribbon domain-containing OB-fold protein [Actinomycetota bacterium]
MTSSTHDEVRNAPPIPVANESTEAFWQLAKNGQLATQRCNSCGWQSYPPRMVCPNCHADPPSFDWTPVSGRGRLATWTIVRDALLPGFADQVPYIVGEVELDEQDGLRFLARLSGIDEDALRVGLRLRACFADGGEGTRVPLFEEDPS